MSPHSPANESSKTSPQSNQNSTDYQSNLNRQSDLFDQHQVSSQIRFPIKTNEVRRGGFYCGCIYRKAEHGDPALKVP
eukprot:1028494-Amphidinium_carterae.1